MGSVTKTTILKFIELIIACCLVGLHYHSFGGNINTSLLTSGTFGGYVIIIAGLFIGIVMETPVNRRIDIFYSIVGIILFVIAGAVNIDLFKDYYRGSYRDTGLAKGVISIIEGVVFLLDAYLTYRGEA